MATVYNRIRADLYWRTYWKYIGVKIVNIFALLDTPQPPYWRNLCSLSRPVVEFSESKGHEMKKKHSTTSVSWIQQHDHFHLARFFITAQFPPASAAPWPSLHPAHLCWSFQRRLIAQRLPSPLMPPLLPRQEPESVWELSAKSKRRRQLSAFLTWRLHDANERDSGSFYDSKACVFTGATFNDGDFGASVKGFTASCRRNLVFSCIIFFSLIAFEVCLPKDEVLSLADAHIINWRLWRGLDDGNWSCGEHTGSKDWEK